MIKKIWNSIFNRKFNEAVNAIHTELTYACAMVKTYRDLVDEYPGDYGLKAEYDRWSGKVEVLTELYNKVGLGVVYK